MKIILVKIGKITNSIKREGVVYGGRKVMRYLGVFLKTIAKKKSGDILFISGGVGDSARFRVFNVAEELNLHGLHSSVAMQSDPFLMSYAKRFKIFVFHKTLWTSKIQTLVEKIKMQKKEIIFDADDLLFDPSYQEKVDYYKNINTLEKKAYTTGLGREFLIDPYVKICTTTTSFLAEVLKSYEKKVFIVPNRLSLNDLKVVDKIRERSRGQQAENIQMGYLSGSIGHNLDFATITDALIEIMKKYPRVSLFLAGPLDIESKLNRFGKRIVRLPFISRDKYFETISKLDINLAPLEIGNPFCKSKSELKFFETGILSVPTVAVRNQTFRETIRDGEDGFLAGSTQEWIEKIGRLIEEPQLRLRMGERAREKSIRDYTNKNSQEADYHRYLKEIIKKTSERV